MTNWNQYYQNYPVNQELIWLNNCGTTPVGNKTIQDVTRYLEAYARKGVFNEVEKYPTVKYRIEEILSELLHCDREEIGVAAAHLGAVPGRWCGGVRGPQRDAAGCTTTLRRGGGGEPP